MQQCEMICHVQASDRCRWQASNAARKLLDAGHLEHIETNKETDPAYKEGSRPKTYITTS
jgi:hypothetical protein